MLDFEAMIKPVVSGGEFKYAQNILWTAFAQFLSRHSDWTIFMQSMTDVQIDFAKAVAHSHPNPLEVERDILEVMKKQLELELRELDRKREV